MNKNQQQRIVHIIGTTNIRQNQDQYHLTIYYTTAYSVLLLSQQSVILSLQSVIQAMSHSNHHPNDLSILYHKQQTLQTHISDHSSLSQSRHKHSITQTSTNLDLDSLMVGLRMVPNSLGFQRKMDGFGVKIKEVRDKLKEIEGMWPGLGVEVNLVFGIIQRMEGKYYGGIRRKEAIGGSLFNSRMIIQKDSSLMGQQQALHQQSRTNRNKAKLSIQPQPNPYNNTLLPKANTRSQSRLHLRRQASSRTSNTKSRIIYTEFSIKQLERDYTVREPQHQHFRQPQTPLDQNILQLSLNPKCQSLSITSIHQHLTNQHILLGKPSKQQQYLISGFNQEDSQLCRLNRHIIALDEVLQNRVFRKVEDFVSVEGGRMKGNDAASKVKRVTLGDITLDNCIESKLMGGDVGKGRMSVGKGKTSRGNNINEKTRLNLSDKQNRF